MRRALKPATIFAFAITMSVLAAQRGSEQRHTANGGQAHDPELGPPLPFVR